MKRKYMKLAALFLAVIMVLSMQSFSFAEENGESGTATCVAKIGNTEYATLKDAVDAAGSDAATITITADIDNLQTVAIDSSSNITLDLNGHKIETGESQAGRHYYAIENYGVLTFKDSSSTGKGIVRARGISNEADAKMTINGGTFIACDGNGGASIWNEGNLTINGGSFKTEYVGSPSDYYGPGCLNNSGTALVTGGDFNSVNRRTYAIISVGNITIDPDNGKEITVAGAHGGLAVDSGSAVVNGGKYSSTDYYGLYVSNDGSGTEPMKAAVTVNGGDFTGKSYSVWIGSDYNNPVNSTIEINGGTFNNPLNAQSCTREGAIQLKGGYYTDKPSKEHISSGYSAIAGNYIISDKAYRYKVDTELIEGLDVDVASGDSSVSNQTPSIKSENTGITSESLKADAADITAEKGLTEQAAEQIADLVTDVTKKQAEDALKDKNIDTSDKVITIVAEPYLAIAVDSYEETGNAQDSVKKLTLDIEALYNIKATTGDPSKDAASGGMNDDNTVLLSTGSKLKVDGPVTIRGPLPDGFVSSIDDNVYVQHKGYEYDTTITVENGKYYAAFVNPHGFSKFVLMTESQAAAEIGNDKFTSLQDAVDAVKDGETINVLKPDLSALVRGNKSFFVTGESADLKAAEGYNLEEEKIDGDAYKIRYTVSKLNDSAGGGAGQPSDKNPQGNSSATGDDFNPLPFSAAALAALALIFAIAVSGRKQRQK